ncbi:MAG: hypothetical protein JSR73_08950 [Proteobacteria bacterium]|nr:hypothetical protein [Pseudomonadota bacterium]
MEYAIGFGLAALVCAFGRVSGFDRDRAFYATMVIVVATYYLLFAAMIGSSRALLLESIFAACFVALAVAGFRGNPWLVVAGLAGHGLFDFMHPFLVDNPGVPAWWPGFCLSFDVLAGLILSVLITRRPSSAVGP